MSTAAHDRDAELAVLAACFISPVAREEARRHLTGPDFYEPRHETIWRAMSALDHHGKGVDHSTLLAATKHDRGISEILPELVVTPTVPEHVAHYAEIVRGWATRRRLHSTALRVAQQALNPEVTATGYAAKVASEFAGIRDSGATEDVTALSLAELLAEADDEPDWLIPGYLERRDRFMLTGEEGLGKSQLLRQFATCAAAGIDPWEHERRYTPVRTLIVDCENSVRQVRTKMRGIAAFARHYGDAGLDDRLFVDCARRMDVTSDRDLARLHQLVDAFEPELIVIGPLYRLIPRAIQTDDDAAPLLAALDTLRDRGAALLIEAHAGHSVGKGGNRDMRPRGSSALLGWPEFGYGMRWLGTGGRMHCQFSAWRGDRSERDWPRALRKADDGHRWVPYLGSIETGEEWSA